MPESSLIERTDFRERDPLRVNSWWGTSRITPNRLCKFFLEIINLDVASVTHFKIDAKDYDRSFLHIFKSNLTDILVLSSD